VNVAMAYIFGVSNGSIPSFERKKRGVDAEMNVGSAECRIVGGAMENGNVQLGRLLSVARIDRGGWVEGVRIIFVRAISSGASSVPAIPAAETATTSEESGEGDDSKSSPPAEVSEMPGSGSPSNAEKKERAKEVIVVSSTLWIYVAFVPFQSPHAPSAVQSVESVVRTLEEDFRTSVWGDFSGGGGG